MLVGVAEAAGLDEGRLTVVVVDDAQMSDLHRQYKRQDGTTDVLTFDLREPPGVGSVEADVVVCFDEAVRQSSAIGHDVRLEVLLYAVHGLLHLIGYDDVDPTEAERMHRREDELLVAVGCPAAYAAAGRSRID